MKALKIFSLLLLVALIGTACEKEDLKTLPACVQDMVKDHRGTGCDKLYSYTFQGEKVYVMATGSCVADGGTTVFDDQCNVICQLSGFGGLTICNGEQFHSSATNEELLWEQ